MSLLNSLISRTSAATEAQGAGNGAEAVPTIRPVFEVIEQKEAYGLTVYLPGVAKDGLEITADGDQLRIKGSRQWKQPEGWTALYRESADVPFELVLEHENAIDVDKIHAELRDGILRASLPKAEGLKPRKIAVS